MQEILPKFHHRWIKPFVIIDPARRGLESGVIESIEQLDPCALAYISCSPKNLARDIEIFTQKGWQIKSLQAYDMIPQSSHTECLVLLEPTNQDSTSKRRRPLRWVRR